MYTKQMLLILFWTAASFCAVPPVAGMAAPITEGRRAKLPRALHGDDLEIGRRALQEILADGSKSEPLTDALVSFVKTGSQLSVFSYSDLVADALRERLTPSRCEDLLNPDQNSLGNEIAFRVLLGMGKEGRIYIPILKKVVAAEESFTVRKVKAEIALANLGVASEEELANIASALQATNQLRKAVIEAMAVVRNNEWLTSEMKRNLYAITEQGVGDSYLAALTVARFAPQSSTCSEALEKGLRRALAAPAGAEASRIICRYGLIKARGSTSPDELRDALKFWEMYMGLDLPERAIATILCRFLLDADQVKTIVKLVDDPDPEVAMGAAKVCYGLGIAAQDAQKGLLRMLENRPDMLDRLIVAFVIGAVAGEELVPELERIAVKYDDLTVKEGIYHSIRVIRLEPRNK